MPYREKKFYCGKQLEVCIYPISVKEQKQPRKTKQKVSVPKQKNLNSKNAKMHLIRLINNNFTNEDLVVHLTYSDENLPENYEEAKKDVTNYLRRLNYYRKKHGLPLMKYIAVIEEPTGKRIHLHVVMSGDVDRDVVEKTWGKGWANADRLQENEYGYESLARYISKDPKGNKRWIPSKNLIKPIPQVNDHRYSRRKVEQLSSLTEDRETYEKLYPGYIFTECKPYVNEVTGKTYLYIRMRKIRK